MDNNYYYGPYGWRGGGYMYNDAWDDYYDHREDAREDWQDHREDLAEERGDRAENRSEQRTERAENAARAAARRRNSARNGSGARQENRPESQAQRTRAGSDRSSRRPPRRARVAPAAPKPAVTANGQQRQHTEGDVAQRQLGRILGIFERKVGTIVELHADSRAEAARAAAVDGGARGWRGLGLGVERPERSHDTH